MRCDEVKEKITLFIEGELEEEEARKIHQHIVTCPECSRLFEELRHLIPLLPSLAVEPSEALINRLINIPSIEQKEEKGKSWSFWLQLAAAASLMILLLLSPFAKTAFQRLEENLQWGIATINSSFTTIKKVGTKFLMISFEIKEEIDRSRDMLKDKLMVEKKKKKKKQKVQLNIDLAKLEEENYGSSEMLLSP